MGGHMGWRVQAGVCGSCGAPRATGPSAMAHDGTWADTWAVWWRECAIAVRRTASTWADKWAVWRRECDGGAAHREQLGLCALQAHVETARRERARCHPTLRTARGSLQPAADARAVVDVGTGQEGRVDRHGLEADDAQLLLVVVVKSCRGGSSRGCAAESFVTRYGATTGACHLYGVAHHSVRAHHNVRAGGAAARPRGYERFPEAKLLF